jgi:hypothetical protein
MGRFHSAALGNREVDRPTQHNDPVHLIGRLGGRREAVLQRQDQPLADRKEADQREPRTAGYKSQAATLGMGATRAQTRTK